jgi:hypothetical protein
LNEINEIEIKQLQAGNIISKENNENFKWLQQKYDDLKNKCKENHIN